MEDEKLLTDEGCDEVRPGLFLMDALNALIGVELYREPQGAREVVGRVLDQWPNGLARPKDEQILRRMHYLELREVLCRRGGEDGEVWRLTEAGGEAMLDAARLVRLGDEARAIAGREARTSVFHRVAVGSE